MKPRVRRAFWIGAGCLGVLVIGLWYFVDVAARKSSFCGKCHYMEPFVYQWTASAHGGVECVRCHPVPRRQMLAGLLKYWSGTYSSRPRAFVPDAACMSAGCHAGMPQGKAVSFKGISFPHGPHLGRDRRGIRLHCASCHGSSQEAGHVTVDERICFLCHFKGQGASEVVAGCGSCHGAPPGESKHGGFIFDMKSYVEQGVQCNRCHLSVHEGDGAVPKERCFSCHVSRADQIGEPKLLHAKHVGQKEVRCLDCHEPVRHGSIKVLSVLEVSCESCHTNLHTGPKEMYLGVGAIGAPSTPSRMFAAQINCTGCHTQVTTQAGVSFLGQGNKTADPRACAACHDARYMPMVDLWKTQGKALAAEARRLAGEGARASASSPKGAEVRKLSDDLEFNARFLEQGHPVHNIEYAIKVLQASSHMAKKLGDAAGTRTDAAIRVPFARESFSYCGPSCHSLIPRQEPYDFQGVEVPHTYHIQKADLSCDTCHSGTGHKALALSKPSDCASCHHDSAEADCSRCHPRQAALFKGNVPASAGIAARPDIMAEAVGCAGCHDPSKPDSLASAEKACIGCHDATYAKKLRDWHGRLKEGRERAQALLDEARMALDNLRRQRADSQVLARRLQAANDRLAYLDKARGIHNVEAAMVEYERSAQEARAIVAEAAKAGGEK